MKKNAGFTLVELIVVIAILGILAGIAIPVYSGYIKRANDAAVEVELSSILTAAEAANATNTVKISKIEVSNGGAVTVTLASGAASTDFYKTFATFQGGCEAVADSATSATVTGLQAKLAASQSYTAGVEWNGTKWSPKSSS